MLKFNLQFACYLSFWLVFIFPIHIPVLTHLEKTMHRHSLTQLKFFIVTDGGKQGKKLSEN